MSKLEISIEGMTCGHCAMTITKELSAIAGVSEVQVDHTTGKARLSATDSVSQSDLEHAVDEAGYRATGFAELQ